jgi:arylsulfatase A-like enzyme
MSSLVVTVDALRTDHLAQFGYNRDTFPVADQVAEEGTTFGRAYANGTNTGISLPSLLTSRYRGAEPATEGETIATALPDDVTTIGVHSNTYLATRVPTDAGFDEFEDFDILASGESRDQSTTQRLLNAGTERIKPIVDTLGIRAFAEQVQEQVLPASFIHELTPYENAERTTDRALELLSTVDGEFFIWIHYMDPHRPYGIDLDTPTYTEPADEDEIRQLMSKAAIHPSKMTEAERQRIVDLYDSDIRYTSQHVARLFDGLRDRDMWVDTDIFVTADHGEEFGDHGFYYHRNRPYDELIHVPLFVRRATSRGKTASDTPPETVASGAIVNEQRELLDLAPTVCSFHSIEPPAAFEGMDLFAGTNRTVVATGSFRDDGPVVGTRRDGWKYIEADDGRELYELTVDPDELTNVADDNPDQCDRFETLVPATAVGSEGDLRPDQESVSPEVADRLEQLGYTD